jgi:hypothetical protein
MLNPFTQRSNRFCVLIRCVNLAGSQYDGADQEHSNEKFRYNRSYFWLFLGVLFGYEGFQRHRRDPEGSEEPYRRNTVPLTGVDTASLVQLSNKHRRNRDS